jgi:hypothetical protein
MTDWEERMSQQAAARKREAADKAAAAERAHRAAYSASPELLALLNRMSEMLWIAANPGASFVPSDDYDYEAECEAARDLLAWLDEMEEPRE